MKRDKSHHILNNITYITHQIIHVSCRIRQNKREIKCFHSGSPMVDIKHERDYYDDEIYEFENYGDNDGSSRNDYLYGLNTPVSVFNYSNISQKLYGRTIFFTKSIPLVDE